MVIESLPILKLTKRAYIGMMSDLAIDLEITTDSSTRDSILSTLESCENIVKAINFEIENKH